MDYVIIHKAIRLGKNLQNQFLVKRLFKTPFLINFAFLIACNNIVNFNIFHRAEIPGFQYSYV